MGTEFQEKSVKCVIEQTTLSAGTIINMDTNDNFDYNDVSGNESGK